MLYEQLKKAKSEEDVKDAYIKALGLKGFTKGLIDIQTNEIWFEAKDTGKHSSYAMYTQLLHYVQVALNAGEAVPPFLAVIDTEKAAIMKTADVLPFLENKTIKWGKSASQYTQEALDAVSAFIGTYFVSFKIATHEEEFIGTVKAAIKSGDIIRTQITPDNLKQVFDKWVALIGQELSGVAVEDYALLFFADIMNDGTVSTHKDLPAKLIHIDGAPAFMLAGNVYELGNKEGYRRFWEIYHRPPKAEYRNYLLERRDSLIPLDERSFKGAYYTPLHVVDKAYDKLSETLGKNWQKDYIVWDMCCGVGYPSPQPSPLGRGSKSQTMALKERGSKSRVMPLTADSDNDSVASLSLRERARVRARVRGLFEESTAVLEAGKKLWQAYFLHTDNRTVRDEYKLNRPDVGWYQIRNALKKRNESDDYAPVSFEPFEQAYKALTEKLRPQVYELGFLRA